MLKRFIKLLSSAVTCFLFCYIPSISGQAQTVQLFAHRGGQAEFDENTMSAFSGSYKKGLRGFETDVRLTKDGVLVISHDASLERIAGQEGIIEDMTSTELKEIKTKKGNPILFLDELLDFFADKPNIYLEFEMKTDARSYPQEKLEKYCDQLYRAVMSKKSESSTYLLTSFDKRPLKYLKTNYPDAVLLFITSQPCSEKTVNEALSLGINRLGCNLDGTSRKSVQKAHEAGVLVSCWPGNSIEDFQLGVALGCDFLCSNVPVQVKKWAKKNMKNINIK